MKYDSIVKQLLEAVDNEADVSSKYSAIREIAYTLEKQKQKYLDALIDEKYSKKLNTSM